MLTTDCRNLHTSYMYIYYIFAYIHFKYPWGLRVALQTHMYIRIYKTRAGVAMRSTCSIYLSVFAHSYTCRLSAWLCITHFMPGWKCCAIIRRDFICNSRSSPSIIAVQKFTIAKQFMHTRTLFRQV